MPEFSESLFIEKLSADVVVDVSVVVVNVVVVNVVVILVGVFDALSLHCDEKLSKKFETHFFPQKKNLDVLSQEVAATAPATTTTTTATSTAAVPTTSSSTAVTTTTTTTSPQSIESLL